jgi:hypothetical protein
LHAFQLARRSSRCWLVAILGSIGLLLATPAPGHAEAANPNNYICNGHLSAGQPEVGSEEQQVQYTFSCNGAITGYQLQSQIPLTGIQSPPLVTDPQAKPLTDTFSCSGEIPGYAINCVGAAKSFLEQVTGQFAIGTKLCAEPRVDTLLTVTYAFVEKSAVVQAISGPFDLGRPWGCPASALSGGTRLDPRSPIIAKHHKGGKRHLKRLSGKKAAGGRQGRTR